MSCITRIKEANLTETEKEIAQYILNHTESVLDESAIKLGEKTHSSSAAIVRFAKKLGYKFVAKNPHACVWDESHISLDIYLENNI